MKSDFRILIITFFTGLIILIFNLENAVEMLTPYYPDTQRLVDSRYYKPVKDLKEIANRVWRFLNGETFVWEDTQKNNSSIDTGTDNIDLMPSPTIGPTEVYIAPSPIDPDIIELEYLETPIKVQLIGDSMMLEGFGPRMESKLLAIEGVSVKRYGKYSTGLNRVDYFDWYAESRKILAQNQPDVLIVFFGGNDGQTIVDESGKSHKLSSDQWDIVYRQRVAKYLQEVAPQVKQMYWVGHPIPRTDDFYQKFSRMNPIYEEECAKFANCFYVDQWSRFAVDGKYVPTLADDQGVEKAVKGSDGVHVTTHGGNIMADEVIKMMRKNIDF